jgi:signal transduction histidine kinase
MRLPPQIRIAGLYIFLGFIWILFSDQAMLLFSSDISIIKELSTFKGWFFVLTTGTMLYFLIRSDTIRNKKFTEELKKAKEKAEESDRLKSRFLSNLSHELRTPMNAILGFSELLDQPSVPEEKRIFYTQIIQNKTTELLQLLNNLIESAKLQEGQLKIIYENVNLDTLLNRIYTSQLHDLEYLSRKKISLKCSVPSEHKNLNIYSDAIKIEYIFKNLIINAIKFTDVGEINFGYKINNQEILCFVSDTGIGIASNEQNEIFNRFIQSNDQESLKRGGTGLGLSIAKSFAELLGGKIWVDSEPQKGSIFYFTLPITKE